MRHLLIGLLMLQIFGFRMPACAQDRRLVDSLQMLLEHKPIDQRFSVLYNMAFEYLDNDNNKALDLISQAEHAALMAGDSLWIVKSKRVKGQLLYKLNRTDEVIEIFSTSLSIAERNGYLEEVKFMCNTFGSTYLYRGQWDKALEFYFRTLDIARQQGDKRYVAFSFSNLGITYYHLNDYKNALEYFKQATEVAPPSVTGDFTLFMNMSLCYSYLKEYEEAVCYAMESLNLCGEECRIGSLMHIKLALGRAFIGQKLFARAESELRESLEYAKVQNSVRMMLDNIYLLAGLYMNRGCVKDAQDVLTKAQHLLDTNTNLPAQMLLIYLRLSEFYRVQGEFEKVATFQKQYIELKDSVFDTQLTTNLMRVEGEFLQRENMAKIAAQKEVISLNALIISRQRILNIMAFALILVSLALLILLVNGFRRKKEHAKILEMKVNMRTRELEQISRGLNKEIQVRDLQMGRLCSAVCESIMTVQGLCVAGRLDNRNSDNEIYFKRIDDTVSSLLLTVRNSPLDKKRGGSSEP